MYGKGNSKPNYLSLLTYIYIYIKVGSQQFWIEVDIQVKNEIKNFILGTLATKKSSIRNVAATVSAIVYSIYLMLFSLLLIYAK